MRYIVTAERPRARGAHCPFRRGDLLESYNSEGPARRDLDGDYYMRRVSDGETGHIDSEQVREGTEVPATINTRAVRAALAVCGLNDEAARKVMDTASKIAAVL